MQLFSIYFVFVLSLFFGGYLFAQQKGFTLSVDEAEIDRSLISAPSSYSSALKKATPAVVAVTTQQVVRRLYPGGSSNPREEFLRRYLGIPNFNNPRIEEEMVPAGLALV
jgi:S1-C subfamily serine protease